MTLSLYTAGGASVGDTGCAADGGCSVDESLDMNDTISGIQTLDVQNMEYTKTDGLNVTMRFRIQIIGG